MISHGNHGSAFLLRKKSPFFACQARCETNQFPFKTLKYLTSLNNMPRRNTPGTTTIALDIAIEAKVRFAAIHEALGFKTKTETFEAIVYAVSTKDKIDPHAIERIERKLDNLMEHLEDFA